MKQLKTKYFLLLLILSSFSLKSQVNCVKFNDTIGCTPFRVSVEYCGEFYQEDGSTYPTLYTFEEGQTTDPTQTTYEYLTPGVYDLRQRIAINDGTVIGDFDTTYTNAFRAVSNPSVQFELTPCNNRSLNVQIDSNSYDFYIITNDINSDKDTLEGFGDKSLDFSESSLDQVEIKIQGLYYNAPCSNTIQGTSILIESMLPLSITKLTEYPTPDITFNSAGPFTHTLNTFNEGILSESKEWQNNSETTTFNTSVLDYDEIQFNVSDACENNLNIFTTSTFTSSTSYENNVNIISETSPSFEPSTFEYLKENIDSFQVLLDGNDTEIICNVTNCYYLRTQRSLNRYNFDHFSSGTCGNSFSNDIPNHPDNYEIDNSIIDSLTIKLKNYQEIQSVEINSDILESIDELIYIYNISDCINLRFQNSCNIWSKDTTLCPLNLTLENSTLIWNSLDTNIYHLFWEDNILFTDTLFFNSISGLQSFAEKDYPAQEFCVFVQSETDGSKSNKLCFKSETFIFIPDIAFNTGDLLIKDKFLADYTLSLYDLNGNLTRELFPSKKSLEGLKTDTYFYILQGVSEEGLPVERKGSIIIKD